MIGVVLNVQNKAADRAAAFLLVKQLAYLFNRMRAFGRHLSGVSVPAPQPGPFWMGSAPCAFLRQDSLFISFVKCAGSLPALFWISFVSFAGLFVKYLSIVFPPFLRASGDFGFFRRIGSILLLIFDAASFAFEVNPVTLKRVEIRKRLFKPAGFAEF